MKNIFGVNVKTDKFDNIEKFKIRDVNPELSKKAEEQYDEFNEHQKSASLPKVVSIIYFISLIAALTLTAGIISGLAKTSFKEAYNNAPALFYIAIIFWIVFIALLIIKKIKEKNVVNSEEFKETINESELLYDECLTDLNIPKDSVKVDVFVYCYKEKAGKYVQASTYAKYIAQEFLLFKEDNKLCLGDISTVLGFDIDSFKRIEKINKKVMFIQWNKETPYNKGEYKDYKIATNNYGSLMVKPYYRIVIEHDYTEFEFYIPPYELNEFLNIVNIDVIEKQD